MSNTNLHGILQLIADDTYAATFQSMAQYRTALMKVIRESALAASLQEPTAWKVHTVANGKKQMPHEKGPALFQKLALAEGWMNERIDFDGYRDAWIEPLYAAPVPPAASVSLATQQEPVAFLHTWKDGSRHSLGYVDGREMIEALHGFKDISVTPLYAAPPLPAAPELSDEDIWHIAGVVTEFNGGSLFNVIQHDCVTAIRASFMDPDTGRALLSTGQP